MVTMSDGYILIARKILQSRLWGLSSSDIIMALTCVLLANHKDKVWFDGKKNVNITRGTFITSMDKLQQILPRGFSPMKIRTSLLHLKNLRFLTNQTTNRYSLITIINYNDYQDKGSYVTNTITIKQQTDNKRITTNNNDNNDNKEKKRKKYIKKELHLQFVLLSKEELQKLQDKFGQTQTDNWIARLNGYIGSKGTKYASHYRTILNWDRMAKEKVESPTISKAQKQTIESYERWKEDHPGEE